MQTAPKSDPKWLLWLDNLAIAAWGVLILKYWLNGKLRILIHPAYTWLCVAAAIGFLLVATWKSLQLWKRRRLPIVPQQHISLFPPGWSSALLLLAAFAGLVITPRPFTSQVALERGVTDALAITRVEPQSFRANLNPEDRSIIDWTRTLSVYPEPDAYAGDPVDVVGFVIHAPDLPENYFIVARFTITCCAADAYPVGLPVKLTDERQAYPPDTWVRVRGKILSAVLQDRRQVAILAEAIESVPEPENPYSY
ncbi:TIGR03943 family protein [Geitlerinema sp. CS-897]|uniref:TIGR03943 family putative permease subunit n=1 Tax=Baaleninema simplex TaxID=2862350 RepID=UPI00034D5CF2|nr:TIGR03943 family protein [Baaleninema simplex]MDC0832437.1 TIGR03943 family protein [Geitlerinema sp. CS-897]